MRRVYWWGLFTLAASIKLIGISHLLLSEWSKGATLVSISFALFIFGWMFLFKKHWLLYGAVASLLIGLYSWSSYLYMDYFQAPFSSYIMLQTANLSGMSDSIIGQISWWQIVFFLDLLILESVLLYEKMRNTNLSYLTHRNYRITSMMAAAAMLLIAVKPVSMYVSDLDHLLLKKFTANTYISNYGIVGHQMIDFYDFISSQQTLELSAEEMEDIHTFLSSEERVTKRAQPLLEPGIFQGKNLLLIQFESLQQFVIGAEVNNQEITPNLNRLAENGLSFERYYPQTAEGNSSDAELLVLNSIYPLKEGSTFFRYPAADYPSIAKTFKEKGYTTSAFHGDEGSFWNRGNVYPAMGFDSYHDIEDYKSTEKSELGMGLSDEAFFEQTADKIVQQKEPFLSLLITLSSHTPYDIPPEEVKLDTGNLKNTHLGNYFESIHYTDHHLGKFFDKLEKDGLLENTVVVIYGDHNGIFHESKAEIEAWRGKEITESEWRNKYMSVPFLAAAPSIKETMAISDVTGQIDTAPTILDWFGFPRETYENHALGHNINRFSNKEIFLLRGDYGESIVINNEGSISEYAPIHHETLEISEDLIKSNFATKP
ncbi:LTA synthase family protein [Thalassobacillus pellis]|uniref:LTA synthase family protein n=1 Tax=Thalassobacillus pellis TaxID=748008 RepID=UPI00196198BA|nr:LTA synthase family protein [Thalassobacillus pellis]MBM7551677.1 phosphoglycerol transferase MdoB-like AlkP superfamily enzyme [Thalassobacillus pellis]